MWASYPKGPKSEAHKLKEKGKKNWDTCGLLLKIRRHWSPLRYNQAKALLTSRSRSKGQDPRGTIGNHVQEYPWDQSRSPDLATWPSRKNTHTKKDQRGRSNESHLIWKNYSLSSLQRSLFFPLIFHLKTSNIQACGH